MIDKERFISEWKEKWEREKKEKTGLGGMFTSFTQTADPSWVKMWEKKFLDAMSFTYEVGKQVLNAESDEEKQRELKNAVSELTRKVSSNVVEKAEKDDQEKEE